MQQITGVLPFRSMAGWTRSPQTDEEYAQHPSKASWRECFYSKAFLRIVLVFVSILLLANLFTSSRHEVRHFDETMTTKEVEENIPPPGEVDWSQFAYCQYVTTEQYLCNSLMIFSSLSTLNARADFLMLYPEDWDPEERSVTGRLLTKARDEYGVILQPIEIQHLEGDQTWADSFTKLLAFNQTQYKRVLSLDSDATVLQAMDELFLLPSAPVAMPRAYWLDDTLSSQLVLVEPSTFEFKRILAAFAERDDTDFDMELVNNLYRDSCFIIPHRRYDLITGEFKASDHSRYLGSTEEVWDPEAALKEAKFLHYSDWPHPKPWFPASKSEVDEVMPKCHGGWRKQDCRDQESWLWFYKDFRKRRTAVCGGEFEMFVD